jgi:hypothetical protein
MATGCRQDQSRLTSPWQGRGPAIQTLRQTRLADRDQQDRSAPRHLAAMRDCSTIVA